MSTLTHLNARGEAHMVDVSDKAVTSAHRDRRGLRRHAGGDARASCATGTAKKGDVLATARIAGIMAAKKTHELIPLCHPLAITKATVDFELQQTPPGIRVTATVKVGGQTGVEMEALTAVSVACLTIYDMLKAAEKGMRIEGVRLVEKTGGKSGDYRAGRGADARPMSTAAPQGALTVEQALAAVLEGVAPVADTSRRVDLFAAAGRVLARAARRDADATAVRRPPPWTAMPCARPMSRRCRRRCA